MTLKRLDRVVGPLMEQHGVDCWILISREYAEDPVVQTMLPATWMSSRRRTILVFLRHSGQTERFAITRYEIGDLFDATWDPEVQPDQWTALATRIRDTSPNSIAVSTSDSFAHADGLTATEYSQLTDALGPDLSMRVVSGEPLAIGWLQTRIADERPELEEACRLGHGILRRALSAEAVEPGVTTTADLEWWLRDRVQELGTDVWFHPTASIQRPGENLRGSFASKTRVAVIEAGDLLHIDFGINWDHLCTDQQQHGYVLKPGESAVPGGLNEAMDRANSVQDILIGNFRTGRTGNDVLEQSLDAARQDGLDPMIYTHPIGYHGHGAGPTIGLWDQQGGVPGSGDVEIFGPSAWSIELSNRSPVAGWDGKDVAIMLEEDAWFEDEQVEWIDGRQSEVWEI